MFGENGQKEFFRSRVSILGHPPSRMSQDSFRLIWKTTIK